MMSPIAMTYGSTSLPNACQRTLIAILQKSNPYPPSPLTNFVNDLKNKRYLATVRRHLSIHKTPTSSTHSSINHKDRSGRKMDVWWYSQLYDSILLDLESDNPKARPGTSGWR
jgi:hypothetical protein